MGGSYSSDRRARADVKLRFGATCVHGFKIRPVQVIYMLMALLNEMVTHSNREPRPKKLILFHWGCF